MIDSPEVLKQLLALPAPTPRHAATPVVEQPVKIRPASFFSKNNPPPDDAPLEDLMQYWVHWSNRGNHVPSDAVRQRLFDACLADAGILPAFLNLLPETKKTARTVKELYDKEQADPRYEPFWREKVRSWLVFNSTYFLDELIGLAGKAKDNDKLGHVIKEDALAALAKVSWTDAEPLLRGVIASGQPRTTALAVSLFYKHALDEKDTSGEERYRRDLQAIAANRTQPGYARNTAIAALSLSEWSGRDDWYLRLFKDETLLDASDGEYNLAPLTTLVISKPDKWIPIMAGLVETTDLNVRSAAAACLVAFLNTETRKDAVMPLLPWLTNPAWANGAGTRLGLLRHLANADVPESVPALIWIVDNDESQAFAPSYAAEALARYKDPRAVPALKRALAKEKDDGQRHRFIRGLAGSQGLTEQEQVEALEEVAAKYLTAEGRQDFWRHRSPDEEPLPLSISIGRFLNIQREAPESVIAAALARAEQLKAENPALAKSLVDMMHQWQGRQVELDLVRRIAAGSADANVISQALHRKQNMQEHLRLELQGLASLAGAAQGVGAVLLNDPLLAQEILTSEDQRAQIALLACARLTQTPLPIEMVGPFLRHKNSMLTAASEAYLLAEDSREAREVLWQRYPNQAFVTGWREDLVANLNTYGPLARHEESLRAEVLKENGPTEILALVHNGPDKTMVLRIYPDKAVFTEQEDAARQRERTVPNAEVSALRDYLTTTGFAERGPTFMWCHHGCPVKELLLLTKEKGRRVFSHGGFDDWMQLQEQFAQLASGEGAKIRYKLEEQIQGLEVLYAGELTVNAVAQQGGELRIFVERPETKEEIEEVEATYNSDYDEDDETWEIQRSRRRVELKNARFSWRVFAHDNLGGVTTQPDFYSTFDESRFMVGAEADELEDGISGQTQVLTPDSIIIARNSNGLWRQFAGAKPVRLGTEQGSYMNPVVTRDGKWVIVAKSEDDSDKPGYVVRLNLQTGREFRVNLPPADQFSPLADLPSHGKVLLRRAKNENAKPPTGPASPEFYLLDPSTGATRLVSGDFKVFHQPGNRFLQPTGKPDEFWAAMPDDKKNQTEIGRYSLQDFSFKPVMVVPQIMFDSMAMWVDAAQAKVYVVYKGQLLRLPLQATAK